MLPGWHLVTLVPAGLQLIELLLLGRGEDGAETRHGLLMDLTNLRALGGRPLFAVMSARTAGRLHRALHLRLLRRCQHLHDLLTGRFA